MWWSSASAGRIEGDKSCDLRLRKHKQMHLPQFVPFPSPPKKAIVGAHSRCFVANRNRYMPFARIFLALAASVSLLAAMPARAEAPAKPEALSLSGAYLAAEVASSDNDLDAAISYFRQALGFDADNPALQQDLMIALITNGQFAEALPLAEKLKAVADIERVSRVALGIEAIRNKEYGAAETWLKLAIEGDLERLMTTVMTAWAKLGQGKADEALALIDKAEGPDWYGLFVAYHGGLIADAAGKRDEAARRLSDAVTDAAGGGASPATYVRAVAALASHYMRNGNKSLALGAIEKGYAVAPQNPALNQLRAAIEAAKPTPPAVATPQQGAGEILYNLGSAINRDGAESFAMLYLQMGLVLKPDDDGMLYELAGIAERLEQPQKAIALYQRIGVGSPFHRNAAIQAGLNLSDLDQNAEAELVLAKLVDEDPTDLRGYLAYGGVLAVQEKYKEASVLYERAALQARTDTEFAKWPLYYRLGIAYERQKNWDNAEPNFKKALELSPDQADVLNYLGYSWIDMGIHLEEGLELIRKAVASRPRDGYIVDSLGWAYYKLGRFEEAVAELEKAVSLMPRDPTINDHLGDAYWRVGRTLEARYQWSQVLDMKLDKAEVTEADVRAKLEKGLPEPEKPAVAKDNATPSGSDAAPKVAPDSGDAPSQSATPGKG